jgi:ATP-dependent DNA ligase
MIRFTPVSRRVTLRRFQSRGSSRRQLAKLVRKASWAVQLNEHIAERGDIVFRHACKLGFEGIVSKRLGSPTSPAAQGIGSRARIRRRQR